MYPASLYSIVCADSGLEALAANVQANLIAVGTYFSWKRESDIGLSFARCAGSATGRYGVWM
jgi:hypothetical protein